MKRISIAFVLVLFAISVQAQIINIHMKNGEVVKYSSSQVDYIDFTDSIQVYLACPDSLHPHMIDLGLPSGTLWSCCNLGASKPEAYGDYYAWGETHTKNRYSSDNYAYYDGEHAECIFIGADIAGTEYDAATANWGSPWRMPTLDQFLELVNNTNYSADYHNGIYCWEFAGKNGASIILPAAGQVTDSLFPSSDVDYTMGFYWTSVYDGGSYSACCSKFFWNIPKESWFNEPQTRFLGCSVRPVHKR